MLATINAPQKVVLLVTIERSIVIAKPLTWNEILPRKRMLLIYALFLDSNNFNHCISLLTLESKLECESVYCYKREWVWGPPTFLQDQLFLIHPIR